MDDNTQILDLIQEIFNSKFEALDKKLDLLTQGLESNHDKLEMRVSCVETDMVTLQNRRTEDKVNIGNEIIKTLIHTTIPVILLAVVYFIQQGKLGV